MARKKFSDSERAQKREDILDAAMRVFESEDGLDALSFRRIASEMNFSYSAPYRYFTNKEELVTALRARAYRWIERVMLESIENVASPEKQLEALALAYIRNGVARPQRYALMFFNLDNTDVAKRSLEFRSAKHDALNVCTQVIAAGQASGKLPANIDPLTAAHLFWIGAHGIVSLEVSGQFKMGRDLDSLVPTLIATLRAGMDQNQSAISAQNGIQQEEERYA